ncbi:uncharacterized protein LOC130904058 [Diorhabda carinulata]|uniref:uncharacterized protein LOC130904058 n=1 Tax=Diorhabda carinulata TaxID=1163345 RepID=UPI0025A245D8|nr:uncharacterized protein LOC130904058 [Diorhabda carinulata]
MTTMTSFVPLEKMQSFKCALCDYFLTIPPIMCLGKDANKYKCGRCVHIPSEASIRNILFEKLAEQSTFPCTFPVCEEVLTWGTVEEHEKVCQHKLLKCPVSWSCTEVVSVLDLAKHCLKFHKKNVGVDQITSTIQETLDKKRITVMLLLVQDIPFLLFKVVTSDNIWIKVFSLRPCENFKYEIIASSDTNECCLSFKNPVEVYVENKHCKKCTLNECDNKLHKKYKKKIDDALADNGFHKITRDIVKELNIKELKCRVILETIN